MIAKATIEDANEILQFFHAGMFYRGKSGRLRIDSVHKGNPNIDAAVCKGSGALNGHYGRIGMGGTCAMAAGQLVLWMRGKPRLPIATWRYWASPKIRLAGDEGDAMVAALRLSTYDDGVITRCVLCGADKIGDWWCLNGVVGPCCRFGRCREQVPQGTFHCSVMLRG